MQVVVLFVAMFGIFDADSFAIILSGVASITGTFLATFIILPKIIAKYLFNPNEQSNIHETIKHLRKSLK